MPKSCFQYHERLIVRAFCFPVKADKKAEEEKRLREEEERLFREEEMREIASRSVQISCYRFK